MESTSSTTKVIIYVRWIARILGTLSVVFFLSFFLGDVIGHGEMPKSDFGHSIVTILFIIAQIGFLLAWRWEGFGGILSAISIILMTIVNIKWVHATKNPGSEIMFLIPALLFIYYWRKIKKHLKHDNQAG